MKWRSSVADRHMQDATSVTGKELAAAEALFAMCRLQLHCDEPEVCRQSCEESQGPWTLIAAFWLEIAGTPRA